MTRDESEQVVALLSQQTYVRETDGPNDSPEIREYQRVTGNAPPDSWCASFIAWGMHYVLGARYSLPLTASCQALRMAAAARRILKLHPSYGAIGLVIDTQADHAHHCFLVTNDPEADGSFTTVEGNSNDNGSSNGDGVYLHHRGGPSDHVHYEFIEPEGI